MTHLHSTVDLILSIIGTVKRKLEIRESVWFCNCFLFAERRDHQSSGLKTG